MYDCAWPWYALMFQWDNLGYCCFGQQHSLGSISKYNPESGFDGIWNHPLAIKVRETIIQGKANKYCPPHCHFLNLGNKDSVWDLEQYHYKNIAMIEDEQQRLRAAMNCEKSRQAFLEGKTVLDTKPTRITINTGSACNIRCKFCFNVHKNYIPNKEKVINILDSIHDTLIYATLTGGEPQVTKLGRYLLEAIGAGKYKFMVILATNGQWIDFDLINKVPLSMVTISTDAATKKTYEKVRVGGHFDDLIKNIKQFSELKKQKPGLEIITNYTVTSDNYHEIPDALELYEGLGMKVQFNLVCRPSGEEQNIRERYDLHEDLARKINDAIALTNNTWTKSKLHGIQKTLFSS